jgi:NAD(P)-dependent dehydrogenase (short-subunit alcohol dehydrogenase family)
MHRLPAYGTSKVAVNGLTAHLQMVENNRVERGMEGSREGGEGIRYYVAVPGFLKTRFTGWSEG